MCDLVFRPPCRYAARCRRLHLLGGNYSAYWYLLHPFEVFVTDRRLARVLFDRFRVRELEGILQSVRHDER